MNGFRVQVGTFAAGNLGDCGMQTGEWAVPETWEGAAGCASFDPDSGFPFCACGPEVRGALDSTVDLQ